jgi:hypothetical protein
MCWPPRGNIIIFIYVCQYRLELHTYVLQFIRPRLLWQLGYAMACSPLNGRRDMKSCEISVNEHVFRHKKYVPGVIPGM